MCAPVMCRGGPTQHSDVGVGPVVTGVLGISMNFRILGGDFLIQFLAKAKLLNGDDGRIGFRR